MRQAGSGFPWQVPARSDAFSEGDTVTFQGYRATVVAVDYGMRICGLIWHDEPNVVPVIFPMELLEIVKTWPWQ